MPKTTVAAIAAAVALALGGVSVTSTVVAQEKQTVSKNAAKPLKAANDAINGKKYDEGLARLQEAKAVSGLTAYDRYVIAQLEAFAYARKGNFAEAGKAMEAQLESGMVPAAEQPKLLNGLATVYYQLKNYAKAAEYGERVIKAGAADGDTYTLVAQSYYLQNKYKDVVTFLDNYVKSQERSGQKPKEQTLQLMSESYIKLNDTAGSTATLEKLVAHYPKPNYWNNLLYVLMRSEGNSDRVMLNIYRLMLDTNTLKQASDYTEMAQLAIEQGVPAEAQSVLEKGFAENVFTDQRDKDRNQRLLEQAKKLAATDQAGLAKFEAEAKAAAAGEADVRLGQAYLSFEQYDKAVEAIQRGIGKGNLRSPEEAQILLGIAQLKRKQADEAAKTFSAVKGNDAKLTRIANLWALHARA
jgi:tetratricopeptide (TPR) repeat protein